MKTHPQSTFCPSPISMRAFVRTLRQFARFGSLPRMSKIMGFVHDVRTGWPREIARQESGQRDADTIGAAGQSI